MNVPAIRPAHASKSCNAPLSCLRRGDNAVIALSPTRDGISRASVPVKPRREPPMRSAIPGFNRRAQCATVLIAVTLAAAPTITAVADGDHRGRPPLPDGGIDHLMVIDLENEDFGTTFGPQSPAVYLNHTLVPQGQLLVNYFATSHVSLGNYISQVSGQAPTPA